MSWRDFWECQPNGKYLYYRDPTLGITYLLSPGVCRYLDSITDKETDDFLYRVMVMAADATSRNRLLSSA